MRLPCMQHFCQMQRPCAYITHHPGVAHGMPSDQTTHFKQLLCDNGPLTAAFTGVSMFPIISKQLALWTVERPFEDSGTVPGGGQTLRAACAVSRCPTRGAVPLTARFTGPGTALEMGGAPCTVFLSDPLATFSLLVPTTLCPAGLETWVPKGGMFLPGDTTTIPLNGKSRRPPRHPQLLKPRN